MNQHYFNLLGNITWLWMNSPLHREWSCELLARNVIPAIENQQYMLLIDNDVPIAYCSWADLSLETEVKYIKDISSLTPEEWQSGDRRWIIDWVAPFGHSQLLIKNVSEIPDYSRQIYTLLSKTKRTGKIAYFKGGNLDKKTAKKRFDTYQERLGAALKNEFNFTK
uniref:Leukotoxin-activating lysine-acyltransferase LktC n=1 Tax=Pasteurella haemolytica-like sp. (strain 5943B) TaxID=53500 RepID=LKTC_PASSP|nr:RecName: Full=Leukotoxin-activating lysine-acyltransferase LktC; Short=Leukotoxin C; Short=Toxin-activating protein C [Mannheimia cf. haemolytica]AAA16443.1 PllktC [Mannheimia cf. haemolytica]prf//2117209A phlC gene [Mannheimia cf. haemolytica]